MKKVPMRMCVACRVMKPKQELTRVVKREGGLTPDVTGKARGRGAYVCKDEACIKKAGKIRGLERALSAQASGDFYDILGMEGQDNAKI
ncbi:MAG: YlxR family protein [Oscillospiraceae bacterium]|nr:YlxR family protein [Oscillospiraceae bacterium]